VWSVGTNDAAAAEADVSLERSDASSRPVMFMD
jgi:hypothetical protein